MKRWTMGFAAVMLATMMSVTGQADDEQIAKTIVERLQQQRQAAQLEGFNLGVQVENGTVTVMGNVSQAEHAMLALDVARRVPGVKLVVNDLQIQGQATATVPAQPVAIPLSPTVSLTAPAAPATTPTISAAGFVAPPAIPAPAALPAPPAAAAAPSYAASTAIGSGAVAQQQRPQQPLAFAPSSIGSARQVSYNAAPEYAQSMPAQYSAAPYAAGSGGPAPVPMMSAGGSGIVQAAYDNPQMPGYAWPSYAAYPNYAAVTYPHQYSPTAWPYIGPFYPYPQVPLGWRKVSLEWDDGWWFLDFKSKQ